MSNSSPLTASILLERLRERPEHREALVSMLVEDFFTRPLREFVQPATLASSLAADLRATVELPEFVAWMTKRFEIAISRLPEKQTPLRGALPASLIDTAKKIAKRPTTPRREIVRALVDQPGIRDLLRTVLKKTLTDFGSKIGSTVPDTSRLPGAGLRSKLMGVAKGVAAVVGSEIERQLDERVNNFLRDTMGHVIDMIVDRICDPLGAKDAASFRLDLIDSLLDLPRHHFIGPKEDLNPRQRAEDLHAVLTALAGWEALEEQLEQLIEEYTGEDLDTSLQALLADSGLEDIWRARLTEEMNRHTSTLFEGEAFADWLTQLCQTPEQD